MPESGDKGRRRFLNFVLGAGSLTFLSAVTYPVLKYLTPPDTGAESGNETVSAGKVNDLALNSGKIVKFGNQPAIVIRRQDNEVKAFLAVCTHLGCTVQYMPADRVIWCACHNGKYDLNGINISGPPPRPLTPLKVNIQNDEIFISREA
ncbi:Rieske 2Fe-2S domain-containing protein [bacterium]|nr:Rieske 2Fe-2S domain-containing protein [bacterium]